MKACTDMLSVPAPQGPGKNARAKMFIYAELKGLIWFTDYISKRHKDLEVAGFFTSLIEYLWFALSFSHILAGTYTRRRKRACN